MRVLLQILFRSTYGDPYAVLLKQACVRFMCVHMQLLAFHSVVVVAGLSVLAYFSSWKHAVGIFAIVVSMVYVTPALNACWMRFRTGRHPSIVDDGCRDMYAYEYDLVRLILTRWDIPRIRVSHMSGFVYKAEFCRIYMGFDSFVRPRMHLAFYLLHETAHHYLGYINILEHHLLRMYTIADDMVRACEKRGHMRLAHMAFMVSGMRLAHAEEYFADAYALCWMRDVPSACAALAYDFGEVSSGVECVYTMHPPLSLRVAQLMSVMRL